MHFHLRTSWSAWLVALLLGAGAASTPPAGNAQGAQAAPHPAQEKAKSGKKPNQPSLESVTVAAVGDIIAAESFVHVKDANIMSALGIIARSDVGFGNLEEALIDFKKFKGYPEAENGGMWLIGEPQVAEDLRAVGFRMLARANNHSTEWGRDGMRETDRALDRAGIVHAGTGENRALARAARFLATPKGAIGLVSMASSFTPSSVASPKQPNLNSRPGMNAIRTEQFHIISPEMMDALVKIRDTQAETTFSTAAKADSKRPTELHLFDIAYRVGSNVGGSSFQMNQLDVNENLASIREGKKHCELLIATIHTHEPGNWSQQPPDFLVDLAHQAVDAGADEFVGHGPHQLRGIEVYKGKPIFYSLGDFIFEVEKQTPVPYEMYEGLEREPAKMNDAELDEFFLKKHMNSPIWYRGVIAVTRFEHGQPTEIHLYPVELGFATQDALRGLPRIPPPEIADEILKRLQKISEPFHTEIRIEGHEGVIRLPGK